MPSYSSVGYDTLSCHSGRAGCPRLNDLVPPLDLSTPHFENFPGGKGSSFRHLINLMPPHLVYIETHLGGGNVIARKRPALRNVGVDVDGSVIARWRERVPYLPFELELHQADAVRFLRSYPFEGGELVYSDPPYLHSTRRRLNLYRHEYTEAQHVELLETLAGLPCAVIVSGYPSSLYRAVLQDRHGWRCIEYPTTTRRGRVIECAWFNFDPIALHDCRYAGVTFRERERIKRRRARWRAKFERMDATERQVVLGALLELASPDVAREALRIPSPGSARPPAPGGIAGSDVSRVSPDVAMVDVA